MSLLAKVNSQKPSYTELLTPSTTSFVYDAYGDLVLTTDPLGNQIAASYDVRGHKLTSSDPDLGTWRYSYDVLGELLTQTDAKGQTASLAYDRLGRPLQRVEADLTSTWLYDTAARGVGALAQATGSAANYVRTPLYDSHGRPRKLTLAINGASHVYQASYTSDSRLDVLSYPSGLAVKYVYTALGYLYQLKDNASGAVLWTLNARDAELHGVDASAANAVRTIRYFDPATGLVQQIRAGRNGVDDGSIAHLDTAFDAIGNLTSRSDALGPYTEYFCYDSLNRLTSSALGGASCTAPGGAGVVKSLSYNDLGNIVSKSDVGSYTYPSPGGTRPHAVSAIAGTVNGILNPRYKYDADGNLTCVYTGANCVGSGVVRESDVWTSYNMISSISEGTNSAAFAYDGEHSRITQQASTGSTNTTTTYLNDTIAGALSEKVVSVATTTWNDYLSADGHLVAKRGCVGAAPCSAGATWNYFVTDHLGSVAVVTDATGNVATNGRMSFDPWGRQRNPNGSDDTACALPQAAPTTRAFTGQEAIPSLCLVNLNARLYDPTIARFMSADTVVPDPTDAQSYNRYSYVNNRPLAPTDPTGHYGDPSFGPCGIACFSDRRHDPAWHPEIRCSGNCPMGSGLGASVRSVNFTFTVGAGDGTTLGTAKLTVNSNGNAHLDLNCNGTDCGALGALVKEGLGDVTTIADAAQAYNTMACQYALAGTMSVSNPGGKSVTGTATTDASGMVVFISKGDGSREIRSGGTVAWRDNNPGNMIPDKYSRRNGAIGVNYNCVSCQLAGGFAIFPDYEHGWNAMMDKLLASGKYESLTVGEAIHNWAPLPGDNTIAYQQDVSQRTGIDVNTDMFSLSRTQIESVAGAIQSHEVWRPGIDIKYNFGTIDTPPVQMPW